MTVYRFQSTIQDISNLARDRYVNTFHVEHLLGDASDAGLLAVSTVIGTFFTSVQGYLGNQCNGTGHKVSAYNLSLAPGSRVPLGTQSFTLAGDSADPLPAEVAMVMTFEGIRQAGVAPQSTRGRMYFGPLNVNTLNAAGGDHQSRPKASFVTELLGAAHLMVENIRAVTDMRMVIASTVQDHGILATGSRKGYPVNHVSADDAWDTQRSRGDRATYRHRLDCTADLATTTF